MKYVSLLIAGIALAGCDITLGADGPVITQSDSIISRVVPIGSRTPSAAPDTTMVAGQTATVTTQAPSRAAPSQPSGNGISLSQLTSTTALPVGVRRSQVEAFKAAVADEGCLITTRQQRNAVQSRTGLDDERIDRIVGYLWREGDLDRRSGSYELTSDRCNNG